MEKIELTVAINSYRNPEILRLCLRSIKKELAGSTFQYEVLVADSATEEDTEILMREEFPDISFFPFVDNVGFKTLINTSLAKARGEYIFLINSDIILTADALPKMMAYLRAHPAVGILGPKQLNFNGGIQESCFHFYRPQTILYRRTWLGNLPFGRKHLKWFTMALYDRKHAKEVDWLMGSALLVTREAKDKVGPMDDRFFMYMEDTDWCRRFWECGFEVVYLPEASVYHYHGKGSAKGGFFGSLLFNRLTWYHIESAIKYFWKYRHKALPRIE